MSNTQRSGLGSFDSASGADQQVSATPRISVNKLAEYMEANPLRRKQIVLDAMDPEPFKVTRYSDARKTLRAYIISGYDDSVLEKGIALIEGKQGVSDWQKDDQLNSLMALRIAMDSDFPDLSHYEAGPLDAEKALVHMKGVDVSVFPDVLLRHKVTGKVGGIKLHIAKTTSLAQEPLRHVATVLKHYLESVGDAGNVDGDACFSIDIFSGCYEAAPKAYKRAFARIEAACEEISIRWKVS